MENKELNMNTETTSTQKNADLIIPTKQVRTLTFNIFRHNPADPNSVPRTQSYQIEESDTMTLFIALNEIRETFDPTLMFDYVCRAGICGSCAMIVNGKPKLTCRTLTKDLPEVINLAPLPSFELIADLSVDTGKWMEGMAVKLETWIHDQELKQADLCKIEDKMEPEKAEQIYELERCIECGCCVAACGTAQMREDFVGAVGINQLARFQIDPRDKREDAEFYQLIGTDDGVFGCMTLLGCDDMCPKDLPLAQQIAYMRRKMALAK